MANPLRLKDTNGNFQELTTSEENYIAHQIGLHLGAADSAEVGSLNRLTTGTNIGTFSNTFFNQPVGTHPSTSITTGTTNTTIYQTTGTAVETDSDVYSPIMWVDSASETGFKMMPDGDLNSAVDRYLTTIFTNEYPGSYRLGSSSPGVGWSVQQTAFVDTRADGTSIAYNLYKKTSASAPATNRPVFVEDSAGGGGIRLREMVDRQIKYSFGQRAKTRIMSSGIGTHQLRSSTAGAPTDPGTWVARGTATDTKQTTSQQLFTRDSTVNFQANYTTNYTSNYATNYTKLSQIGYARLYTSNYLKDYTASYQNEFSLVNYTRTYETGFDRPYTNNFQAGYTGGAYLLTFAGTYTPNYIRNYEGNYQIEYTSPPFNTGFVGPAYQVTYTGNYVPTYTNTFAGSFVNNFQSSYTGTYTGNYLGTYTRNFAGGFAGGFAAGYVLTFAGAYVPNYIRNYEGNYLRNFQSGYEGTYSGSYVPNYQRGYTNNFAGSFNGLTYSRSLSSAAYAGGYLRGNFIGFYLKDNYVRNYTRSYTGIYYERNDYQRNYTRNFVGNYIGNFARAFEGAGFATLFATEIRGFMSGAHNVSATLNPETSINLQFNLSPANNNPTGPWGFVNAGSYTGTRFFAGRARTLSFVSYRLYLNSYTGPIRTANTFADNPLASYTNDRGTVYISTEEAQGYVREYVRGGFPNNPTLGTSRFFARDYVPSTPHDLIAYVSVYTGTKGQYVHRVRLSGIYSDLYVVWGSPGGPSNPARLGGNSDLAGYYTGIGQAPIGGYAVPLGWYPDGLGLGQPLYASNVGAYTGSKRSANDYRNRTFVSAWTYNANIVADMISTGAVLSNAVQSSSGVSTYTGPAEAAFWNKATQIYSTEGIMSSNRDFNLTIQGFPLAPSTDRGYAGNRTYTGNVLPYEGYESFYTGNLAVYVNKYYIGSSGGQPAFYGVGENPGWQGTGLGLVFTLMMDTHHIMGYTGGYVLSGLNETAYQVYGRAGYMTSQDGPGTRDLLNPNTFTGPLTGYLRYFNHYTPGPQGRYQSESAGQSYINDGNQTGLLAQYIRDQGRRQGFFEAHVLEALAFTTGSGYNPAPAAVYEEHYGGYVGSGGSIYAGNYTGIPRVLVSDQYMASGMVQINSYTGAGPSFMGPVYVPNYTRNYTRDALDSFATSYLTVFGGDFLRVDNVGFAASYVSNFTGTYVAFYERNFVVYYERGYQATYVRGFANNFVGGYEGPTITEYYLSSNYVRDYSRNFLRYKDVAYTAPAYTGNYDLQAYTRNYTRNYTRDFVNTFNAASPATEVYEQVAYVKDYTRNYTRNYTRTFDGAAYLGNYDSVNYTPNYTRAYTPNYIQNYVKNRDIAYTSPGVVEYYDKTNYTANYLSVYTNNYIKTYTGGYDTQYLATYTSNYDTTYENAYQKEFETTYTADYVGDYEALYTKEFQAQYITDYLGNFIGNFEGETIDATSETNETYTLYVRIA